jgi:hypothetical protein
MMKPTTISNCAEYCYQSALCRGDGIDNMRQGFTADEAAIVTNYYCRIVFQRRFDSLRAYWLYITTVYRAIATKVFKKCRLGA